MDNKSKNSLSLIMNIVLVLLAAGLLVFCLASDDPTRKLASVFTFAACCVSLARSIKRVSKDRESEE